MTTSAPLVITRFDLYRRDYYGLVSSVPFTPFANYGTHDPIELGALVTSFHSASDRIKLISALPDGVKFDTGKTARDVILGMYISAARRHTQRMVRVQMFPEALGKQLEELYEFLLTTPFSQQALDQSTSLELGIGAEILRICDEDTQTAPGSVYNRHMGRVARRACRLWWHGYVDQAISGFSAIDNEMKLYCDGPSYEEQVKQDEEFSALTGL